MAQCIDKDALLAEIKRLRKEDGNPYFPSETADKYYARGVHFTCDGLVNFLNTLEVKEVDLEKVIEEYFKGWTDDYDNGGAACHYQYIQIQDCKAIAKHFFELGLKAARNNN